jgi:membrane protease YdiL (CAAX protease family)
MLGGMASDFEPIEPDELPPEVLPVEPPLVQAARPGPNIGIALLWWLALFGAQMAISVVVVVAVIVVVLAVHGRGGLSPNLFDMPGMLLALIAAATAGTLLIAVAAVAIMFRRRAPEVIALRPLALRHAILVLLMVLPMLLVGGEVQWLAGRVLPHLGLNDPAYEQVGRENWAIILIVACLLPGVGEELFFRAFLGRGLVARHGVVWGTLCTAALFGALHLDPPQVVGTAALGLVFQIVYLNTKSFLAPAIFHALNNAAAFGLMHLAADPQWRAVLGEDDSVPPLLAAAALAALLALCWLIFELRTRWVLPDGRVWSPGYVTAEMPPAHLGAVAKLTTPSLLAVVVAVVAYVVFAGALAWELRAAW